MNNCNNCNGEGLVGQGPEPWLRHGKLETCPKCSGTGKATDAAAEAPVNAAENTSQESQPVDNSQPNFGDGSQENSGGNASPETAPLG